MSTVSRAGAKNPVVDYELREGRFNPSHEANKKMGWFNDRNPEHTVHYKTIRDLVVQIEVLTQMAKIPIILSRQDVQQTKLNQSENYLNLKSYRTLKNFEMLIAKSIEHNCFSDKSTSYFNSNEKKHNCRY